MPKFQPQESPVTTTKLSMWRTLKSPVEIQILLTSKMTLAEPTAWCRWWYSLICWTRLFDPILLVSGIQSWVTWSGGLQLGRCIYSHKSLKMSRFPKWPPDFRSWYSFVNLLKQGHINIHTPFQAEISPFPSYLLAHSAPVQLSAQKIWKMWLSFSKYAFLAISWTSGLRL